MIDYCNAWNEPDSRSPYDVEKIGGGYWILI